MESNERDLKLSLRERARALGVPLDFETLRAEEAAREAERNLHLGEPGSERRRQADELHAALRATMDADVRKS